MQNFEKEVLENHDFSDLGWLSRRSHRPKIRKKHVLVPFRSAGPARPGALEAVEWKTPLLVPYKTGARGWVRFSFKDCKPFLATLSRTLCLENCDGGAMSSGDVVAVAVCRQCACSGVAVIFMVRERKREDF